MEVEEVLLLRVIKAAVVVVVVVVVVEVWNCWTWRGCLRWPGGRPGSSAPTRWGRGAGVSAWTPWPPPRPWCAPCAGRTLPRRYGPSGITTAMAATETQGGWAYWCPPPLNLPSDRPCSSSLWGRPSPQLGLCPTDLRCVPEMSLGLIGLLQPDCVFLFAVDDFRSYLK